MKIGDSEIINVCNTNITFDFYNMEWAPRSRSDKSANLYITSFDESLILTVKRMLTGGLDVTTIFKGQPKSQYFVMHSNMQHLLCLETPCSFIFRQNFVTSFD